MTAALDSQQRTSLERLVSRGRRILEDDLVDRASGRFGIDIDGTVAEEGSLHLDPAELAQRRELVDVLDHLRSEGEDPRGAVRRLLREATFTHLNRLVAIRIAEALALLPQSLAQGRSSQGFRDLLELVPCLVDDDTGGYWTYLALCGDELAGDVPALFDPRNPLLALTPGPRALDDLVDLLAAQETSDLWVAPDCLGWVYQFFNTGEERRAMRETSAAPRDSRELAVRNQFFTPRYVVDFLVQNSLGRRLIDADPNSPLLDDLPFLIDPPSEPGEPVDLDHVSMLDPACGSGHFLLAGYDILERAWEHAGVDAARAAPAIVRALWGIDIDPRCTQVAAAAVIFRARRSCPEGDLPRPNIICARSLPATSTGLDEVLATLPDQHRKLVLEITEAMAGAPILGSLLKIEERLATEVRAAAFGGATARGTSGTLADAVPEDSLQVLEDQLLAALDSVANATTAGPAERLLAAEADDAIRFVHAMQRRYDAVVMNPPFGEPVPATKPYLRQGYPSIPSNCDLIAAFVVRGLSLCSSNGYLGTITSRGGLYLKSSERWRTEIILDHLVALADLGFGVMEQALVEAAAYVLAAKTVPPGSHATVVRLLRDIDRPAALASAMSEVHSDLGGSRVFRVSAPELRAIPGSPLAYWLPPDVRRLFLGASRVEGGIAEVRAGLCTGDDFRFIRCSWEVHPDRITRGDVGSGLTQWVPFAKGGEYSPFWADVHLLVNWKEDGRSISDAGAPGTRIQNRKFYCLPGITWPLRTAAGFGPRLLPIGCIFGHKGPGALATPDDALLLLGWLTTRLAESLIAAMLAAGDETTSGTASKSYEVGVIQRLPWPEALKGNGAGEFVRDRIRFIVERTRAVDQYDETSHWFIRPRGLGGATVVDSVLDGLVEDEDRYLEILQASYEIERCVHEAIVLDDSVERFLDDDAGPHPLTYSSTRMNGSDEAQFAKWYSEDIDVLIDELIATTGGARTVANLTFRADRRLEVLARGLKANPALLIETRRRLKLLPPKRLESAVADLLSYAVGLAFGRWDLHADSAALPRDVFSHPPRCSPGMLVDERGSPRVEAPPGYPLRLPPTGILLDQPGHVWDIEAHVVDAWASLWDDPDAALSSALKVVGRRSIREFLRYSFFKSHLSRYSKSRRKAPIYWPLYVPSGNWGLWVYAPVLSRETLFAVAGAASERLDLAESEIRRLVRERESASKGRSDRDVANILESEEKLAEELRRFRDEAERIAGLGWEPDLDDGIILCAAPVSTIFPAWKDAATARKEIKAGKYPWAKVSKWADEL